MAACEADEFAQETDIAKTGRAEVVGVEDVLILVERVGLSEVGARLQQAEQRSWLLECRCLEHGAVAGGGWILG